MAEVVGYGPLPMGIAGDLLVDTAGRRWWRRLFTRPAIRHTDHIKQSRTGGPTADKGSTR